MIVSGTPTTKDLKDSFMTMMNQLGPKQLDYLKQAGLQRATPEAPKAAEAPKVNFQSVAEQN